jgi:plastocyanin
MDERKAIVRTRRLAALALAGSAATAAALTVVPATVAHAAAQTITVDVGGDSTVSGVGFEAMSFYAPPNLSVHKGDTINFVFKGFHTATLIPTGVGAEDWRADNTGPGGAYALIQPDSDDTPAAFAFNNRALFPTDPTCGTTGNPCTYTGNTVVSSGVPIQAQSFAVTINANPGDTFWVLCLIHGGMETRISVVANNVTSTTQAQINSYESQTLSSQHAQARAEIPVLEHPTSHKTSTGRVWTAFAGFDGNGWGLDGMFPKVLHIRKGDTVSWHFGQLMGNIHTVTFPRKTAINFSNFDFGAQNVKCEGANGDTPPDAPPPTFCSSGIQNLEFELRAIAVTPQGSGRYRGTGLHSSGVRGPDGLTTAPYNLRFTRRSGTKGYSYACGIHGSMMSGKVYVR